MKLKVKVRPTHQTADTNLAVAILNALAAVADSWPDEEPVIEITDAGIRLSGSPEAQKSARQRLATLGLPPMISTD